ncbi:MAG TPA: IS30 family transposase [Verrucomicrobiae bacterium]|nr:IS30 family transposase [Verrucomicrobiae bacterium]
MMYNQITSGERYTLAALHVQGLSQAAIARHMGRHPSTVSRELKRNSTRYDGAYRPLKANERTNGRRSRSRRNRHFGPEDLHLVEELLREKFSPEQVAGYLSGVGLLNISHETIYQHIWRDLENGGALWKHLRCSPKQRRKRYGRYDSRGRLAGKKMIEQRPAEVETREEPGHWEMDTVMGRHASAHCIVTLVERKTGYVIIGKLRDRTKEVVTARVIALIQRHRRLFKTITADNGTEFHDYKKIEKATGVSIYFAHPYHSWERGTNENTNGLIRQYLPKRVSMGRVTQHRCNAIALQLNIRPRKRHGFKSPVEKLLYAA